MATLWHDDDLFWEELLPYLIDDSMLKAAAADAPRIAELLNLAPGGHVLDLCCGPGRSAVELARLGYRVTGVDRTLRYLEVARDRCLAAGVEAELVHESMLTFQRSTAFDAALSLFTSFGYYENRDDDFQVLVNIRTSLKPGGRLLVDLIGKEIVARIYMPKGWQELSNGRMWLQEREVLAGWEMVRNHWVYTGNGERRDFYFEHRVYSGVELTDMLKMAGFVNVKLYGGFDQKPYDREAARLIAVAEAPAT